MKVADPSPAVQYRDAWAAVARRWDSRWSVLTRLFSGVADSALNPLLMDIERTATTREMSQFLLTTRERLLKEFPFAHAVALSLRYRDGVVHDTEPCLTFFVANASDARSLPGTIAGLPTDVVVAGMPVLHASAGHQPGVRLRPATPGCSVSHERTRSGTLGCLVRDQGDALYVLSCAHVLAHPGAQPGDAIVQAGTSFGGAPPGDMIARFTAAAPLQSGSSSLADAAIAAVDDPALVVRDIRYIGRPAGTRTLSGVGYAVKKSGDETGLTRGFVTGINGTVGPLAVNGVANVYFHNVIITTGMSRGGDSGAILMDNRNYALGVLFGGLEIGSEDEEPACMASWFSPIDPILSHFGVHLA